MVRAQGTASRYGTEEHWGFNDAPTLRAHQNGKDLNFHQIDLHADHKIAEGEQVEFAVDLQADCPRALPGAGGKGGGQSGSHRGQPPGSTRQTFVSGSGERSPLRRRFK